MLPSYIKKRWNSKSGYKEVLTLAIPLVLSTGSYTIYQFINRIFLSRFSPDALAASLPAGILSFAVMAFFLGTTSYVSTFVAQYKGAGESHKAAGAVWQSMYFAIASGILMLCFVPLAEPIFKAANHGKSIELLEISYFKILTAGAGFGILSSAVSGFFSGLGKPKTIMTINMVCAGINVVLDYALIFGKFGCPRLGIIGAGYAVVITSILGCVLFLFAFFRKKYREEYGTLSEYKFDQSLFKRMLKYATPSGIQFMLEISAFALFTLIVGKFGVTQLGATNLALQINTVAFLPMLGFSIAVATLVGQRLGENNPSLAEKAVWSAFHITILYMTLMALLYWFIPRVFLIPFGNESTPGFVATKEMAVVLLKFVAAYSIFDTLNLILSSALRGAGDTVYVMMLSTSLSFGLMVIPTWAIQHYRIGGIYAAWFFLSLYVCVLGFAFLFRFLRGKWKSMRVIETEHVILTGNAPHAEVPACDGEIC